jgi:hypothetical protein
MDQRNQYYIDYNALPESVEVVEPVKPAIETVKYVLFRPFDLGKWCTIGFCAWLAMLGQASFQFNYRSFDTRTSGGPMFQLPPWLVNNLPMIIMLSVGILIFSVAVSILVLWLSSRGWFMFLYCTANNKSQVTHPWKVFRPHGNSLFLFRLVLGLICFVVSLVLVGS